MIGRTIAHYRVTERLGSGGMGAVYKAEDLKLGRTVALKFLSGELTRDPEAKKRFAREARAASLLDHPNICTVYDFGEADEEQMFIAMACYDGESLQQRIRRGALPFEEALRVFEQVARGLAKAHASGVVHRDIKPGNVMVTSDGVVKIVDFGLAKLSGATALTRSHKVMGTAAYMAPEQLRGEETSPSSDIWALGVLLYELLSGRRPFDGERNEAMVHAILHEAPAPLAVAGAEAIDPIIRKMLRKDPLQRYASVDEVLADVKPFLAPSWETGPSRRSSGERHRLRNGARLGPYEIVRPIGSGGMGDVYLAKDIRLDREVAIKVLAPEFIEDAQRRERFKREAKAISSLNHSNVCMLFDVGEQDDAQFLVMEYIEGETLAERLARGPLPLHQVLRFGQQIADALDRAHRQGIVHRDLKPGNVMITTAGAVKLLDYGLAKDNVPVVTSSRERRSSDPEATAVRDDQKPLTAEGTIVGTIAYMAPEQIEGRSVDARTDLFALGTILYEMVTGKRAFEGTTRASLIVAILDRDPVPTRELQPQSPAALDHVIRTCLEKDPESRWQSARDVVNELRWIEQRGASEGDVVASGRMSRRMPFAAAAAAIVAVVLGMIAWTNYRDAHRPRPLRHLAIWLQDARIASPNATNLWDLSPDGTVIAYTRVGESTNGAPPKRVLAIQRLDDGSVTMMAGTDGATGPFFAPDGLSVGYEADGKLYRVLLSGGTPTAIAPAINVRGATWGPDGTIVFGSANGLMRVPASGGNPVPVGAKRPGEASHRHPQFLPDGRHVLFTIRREDVNDPGLAIVDLVSGQRTDLAVHGYYGRFAGGHLFFSKDNTTVAVVRFDPRTLKIESQPRPISASVASYSYAAVGFFSISADGSLLYVAPSPPVEREPVLIDATGGTTAIGTVRGDLDEVSLSPDGKKIAFSRGGDDPYAPEMWVCDTVSGSCGSIGLGDKPVFSPDGTKIVYNCADGPNLRTLCIAELGAGTPTHVLKHEKENWFWPSAWSWTSDSRSVVFGKQSNRTGWGIFIWEVEGGDDASVSTKPILDGSHDETLVGLSPDNRWLSYVDLQERQNYVMPFSAPRSRWLVPAPLIWSRDATRVYYQDGPKIVVRDVLSSPTFELGPARPLFEKTGVDVLAVTPDGAHFIGVRSLRDPKRPERIDLIEGFLDHLD